MNREGLDNFLGRGSDAEAVLEDLGGGGTDTVALLMAAVAKFRSKVRCRWEGLS